MRRSREAVKYNKPVMRRIVDNFYLRSIQGIEQMKEEIKGEITRQQVPDFLVPRKLSRKVKDPNLFLSSMNNHNN